VLLLCADNVACSCAPCTSALAGYAKHRDRRFSARPKAYSFVNKDGNRLDKARPIARSMHHLDKSDYERGAGGSVLESGVRTE